MKRLKKVIYSMLAGVLMFTGVAFGARTDMVDVSNHNGYMTVDNWTQMRNQYGVKAMVTKLTEGTGYQDPTAQTAIQTAKQSGLYVNGYFFCRYTNIAQAKAEAQYAVNFARQIGLPTNAVVCADIESPQQHGLGTYLNDLAISAMRQVVQNAGYRFDVYSMASFGDRAVPWKDMGWIASYPYNLTRDLYTHGHAWQFRSDQYFNGSYGKFDVSQLYDNYYTGGLDKNAVISNDDTHQVDRNHGVQSNQMNREQQPSSQSFDYVQNGVFVPNTTLNIRTAPSVHSRVVGTYAPGERVYYDHVYIRDGYAWARYLSYSGSYHYIALGQYPGASFGARSTNVRRSYVVHSGDTLSGIANRLGVSVSNLSSQVANPNLIYPGEVLYY